MLPAQITFNDVQFQLASAQTGAPNAVVAKGQTIDLPAGHYNRVYMLAASAKATRRRRSNSATRPSTSTSRIGEGSSGNGMTGSGLRRTLQMTITVR